MGLTLVHKILILRRPMKGTWGICLCKKECLWPMICDSLLADALNSLLSLLVNHGHMMCSTLSVPTPATDLYVPLRDLQLEMQVRVSRTHW